MAVLLLGLYALLATGIIFCLIAGSAREHDSLIRRLDEAHRDQKAYHDLYKNAIYKLGARNTSPRHHSTTPSLPQEAPHAKI